MVAGHQGPNYFLPLPHELLHLDPGVSIHGIPLRHGPDYVPLCLDVLPDQLHGLVVLLHLLLEYLPLVHIPLPGQALCNIIILHTSSQLPLQLCPLTLHLVHLGHDPPHVL